LVSERWDKVSAMREVVVAATNPRSQITIFDVAKLGVMLTLGFGAMKLVEGRSGSVQLGAFVVGFISLPLLLWAPFAMLDKRKSSMNRQQ
jgi:sugar phosphate permease